MVEISLSGSGEGPGWVTAPGYSTAAFPARVRQQAFGRIDAERGGKAPVLGLAFQGGAGVSCRP